MKMKKLLESVLTELELTNLHFGAIAKELKGLREEPENERKRKQKIEESTYKRNRKDWVDGQLDRLNKRLDRLKEVERNVRRTLNTSEEQSNA